MEVQQSGTRYRIYERNVSSVLKQALNWIIRTQKNGANVANDPVLFAVIFGLEPENSAG